MSVVTFFVNGKQFSVNNPDPELTLAYYIRNNLRLTGTKLACEEGACGACTVVIGKWDKEKRKANYYSMNACLVPLYMVDRQSVITVEGICKERVHPIQERLSRGHGTQCGFCSPGFTMALYALVRNNPNPTKKQITQAVRGNLCRCTGYRPILEAFYSFSSLSQSTTLSTCCGGGQNGGCPCKDTKNDQDKKEKLVTFDDMPSLGYMSELIFPPNLVISLNETQPQSIVLKGTRITVHCPVTVPELQECSRTLKDFRIVSSGMMSRFKAYMNAHMSTETWISIHKIPEMHKITVTDNQLIVHAGLSIGELEMAIRQNLQYADPIVGLLEKYSADQVKNNASWVGALFSSTLTSDICSLAMALNWNIRILNLLDSSTETITSQQFFSERRGCLKNYEMVEAMEIPLKMNSSRVFSFKNGARLGADATVVNMVTVVDVEEDTVDKARVVFGMRGKNILAEKLANALIGRKISELSDDFEAFGDYETRITEDLSMIGEEKEIEFERRLCLAALLNVFSELNERKEGYHHIENDEDDFTTTQIFTDRLVEEAVGRPLAHEWAGRHVSGVAKYINDLKFDDLLHLCPVLSTIAHGNIISIDPARALLIEGVVDYIDIKDIPKEGSNTPYSIANVKHLPDDTKVFADGKVESIGQVIGAILATDVTIARRAAKLVDIKYEELPAIATVQEALTANNRLLDPMIVGSSEEEVEIHLSNSTHVMSGTVDIGGQEHHYMETQSTVVQPGEDGEFTIFSSTQCASWVQEHTALVLGVPTNKIVVKVKRLGGGFGGKSGQNALGGHAAAVGAMKQGRSVSVVLDRRDDMIMTGKRHPMHAEYRVGFDDNGKMQALHMKFFLDGGHTIDHTPWVMAIATTFSTQCYAAGVYRTETYPLKTNKHSNTAFRGYGQPQANFVMERILYKIGEQLGISNEEIKERNFVPFGDNSGAGIRVKNCGMIECWNEVKRFGEFEKKKREVEEFNRSSKFIKRGVCISSVRFPMPLGGPLEQAHALVQIATDGSVTVSIGGIEMGQGLNVKMMQCASKALKLPIDRVNILDVGTDKTINAPLTGGSQNADLHGKAVKVCCEKLLLGLEPFLRETNDDWNEAVKMAYLKRIPLQTSEHITIEREKHGLKPDETCYYTSGAACSMVDVDCLTGEHKLLSVDIVMDCGESLNPAIDIGQIEGGFMQGYGLMTCEELEYDENCRLLNDSSYKYKIPTIQMCPNVFRVKLIDGISNYPDQIYSSKGVGEPPLLLGTSVHSAIVNSIMEYRKDRGMNNGITLNAPLTAKAIQFAANS